MRILLLALIVGTAGCLQAPAETPQEATETPLPDGAVMWTEVGEGSFYWAAGAANAQVHTINAVRVEVPAGAQNMTLDATWACAAAFCPVVAELLDPADERVAEASGDAGARFQIDTPRSGEWTVRFSSVAPTIDAQGKVVWTIMGAGEVPS